MGHIRDVGDKEDLNPRGDEPGDDLWGLCHALGLVLPRHQSHHALHHEDVPQGVPLVGGLDRRELHAPR